ncbi:UDP-N-acetylmuramoyl-L-alanine--D-glutamate ligase [Clostridium sporogenes]|uniref:UDP-N-acetylmuramoylalanine--D-glutamate ligase n=1 Tax=Clostridium botulinum TaxID=1491 RepID=A0A6M0T2K7_CLOBO|nr:UDP-N-acetylmuramoyl-L-alanine--D-glutamate ligase [Clostridium sporogenes]NFA62028.1 UDP-N-acetylmuramoyl-L-alanine--D-glutamate ligase [Clostridium botulinum]NFI75481.1 UDP-N-acetylmuramoyl-L-alanine--D-glutamate ligase [Clostridium sporogenes]NFL73479.1 UDP-N-acetylmuramoyl-L-alanine--D-glutamate ligase [Clostridium sporogenes]NFM25873.1 UDP-N-acetylmuramoyl-L-alanine--D-glutamate ligase [Clostridium sporogenes]NFP63585.1 UDP-N-acetylmuramoyl-L-alanine--D-glutamate ligase [Clostridium sp
MKSDFSKFKDYIKYKKVAVVGIGVSNRPLIKFLVKLGAEVTAFDKKHREKLGSISSELEGIGVNLVLGEDYLDKLDGYDIIFKTPSMRIDRPEFVKAKEAGAYITSEMEEFIKYCPAKIFGITGSDGKTTTTTLIYEILRKEGYKTWVGGNIGTPLFANIEEIKENHMVVLELSSFQLMTMDVSPQISLITNLSPNHLDVHKDFQEYVDAKKNIFKHQENNDLLVLNKDDKLTDEMKKESLGKILKFSLVEKLNDGACLIDDKLTVLGKEVCHSKDVKLKGRHNIANLLAAFCMVNKYVSIDSMKYVATNFSGVEHRCEFIREVNGVKYYNDSIASSPSRTLAGLNAFEKPVILIAGGYDKKIPFEPLAEGGYDKIKTLILMGDTKNKIKAAFEKVILDKKSNMKIVTVDSMEEAVKMAYKISEEGDIITLSPACASFDMYPNFEIRGNEFKNIVNGL